MEFKTKRVLLGRASIKFRQSDFQLKNKNGKVTSQPTPDTPSRIIVVTVLNNFTTK